MRSPLYAVARLAPIAAAVCRRHAHRAASVAETAAAAVAAAAVASAAETAATVLRAIGNRWTSGVRQASSELFSSTAVELLQQLQHLPEILTVMRYHVLDDKLDIIFGCSRT